MRKYIVMLGKMVVTDTKVAPELGSTDTELIVSTREKYVCPKEFDHPQVAQVLANRIGGIVVPIGLGDNYE